MSTLLADCKTFKPSDWVLVGDMTSCEYTKQQVALLQQNKIPLHGAILCDDEKSKDAEVCKQIPNFPAFCNVKTNLCVPGYRALAHDFDELQRKSDSSVSTH